MRTMSFDLVIFDCDGVLIDSEPIARSVLLQMLSRADLAISASEAIEIFGGRSAVNCMALMEERRGRPLPSGFLADWNRVLYDALARDVRPIAGVVAAIDALQVPVCVASNSSHERMRVSLRACGLLVRFEGRLFSANDVSRGKPFPDLFLHAARTLCAAPERCAVVEDSPVGVAAGVAAGMEVFGYAAADGDRESLRRAGATVFRDMADLPALLNEGLQSAGRVRG